MVIKKTGGVYTMFETFNSQFETVMSGLNSGNEPVSTRPIYPRPGAYPGTTIVAAPVKLSSDIGTWISQRKGLAIFAGLLLLAL